MNAKEIVYKFQMEKFKVFEAQDPENGKFDIVFEIDGKKLYAHKIMLWSASPTLEAMTSERWTKSNDPITIKNYSYDAFKEFLSFIYSGECQLTNDNIMAMVDMAEFYDINFLKDLCEEYLTKMELNHDNIYQMIDLASKYSMVKLDKPIIYFISNNLSGFLQSEHFLSLQKPTLIGIVKSIKDTLRQEDLFEAVYKWAENQAMEKPKCDETVVLNELIKNELSDFLPFIKFDKMNAKFLIDFVVKKFFLFTDDQLQHIFFAQNKVYVKVTDSTGKLMKGELKCDDVEKVVDVIHSLKDEISRYGDIEYLYWPTEQRKPSTPCKLIENENIKYYLLYDHDGDIAVNSFYALPADIYLLAEMFGEDNFDFENDCKIEIV